MREIVPLGGGDLLELGGIGGMKYLRPKKSSVSKMNVSSSTTGAETATTYDRAGKHLNNRRVPLSLSHRNAS